MEFQMYRDIKLQWRWRLVAINGRTIADSGEGYYNRNDCLEGIRLVKSTDNSTLTRVLD